MDQRDEKIEILSQRCGAADKRIMALERELARLRAPSPSLCAHVKAIQWEEVTWCQACGAVNPVVAVDIPAGEWTAPHG